MPATLLCIVGPTCTGKTRLAARLARSLQPAELVNADSRQVLRGLKVGTSAPAGEELEGVRWHLLGVAEPGEPFTVADWAAMARTAIAELADRGALPIVVGGTGLYVSALVDGPDFGSAAPEPWMRVARTAVASRAGGVEALGRELQERDPESAGSVDLRNPRRVIRALEILDAHPEGLSSARGYPGALPAVLIGLDAPPEIHRAWVRDRATRMFSCGSLLSEVTAMRGAGFSDAVLAASGIGYREAIDVLGGATSTSEALDATVRRTLRYAKAQRTFWRRDGRIEWREAHEVDAEALVVELRRRPGFDGIAGLRGP